VILIRGTSLTGFVELVDELGGDGERMLRRAGVDPGAIGDFGAFIPYRPILDLMEDAAAETGALDFGRRLGSRQGLDVLGSVGAAARSAATVGRALTTIERYLRAYTPAIDVTVRPDGPGRACLETRRTVAGLPAYPQAAELSVTVCYRIIWMLVGRGWQPVQVDLPHRPVASLSSYEAFYGAPVRFGRSRLAVVLDAADLDKPLSSDETTHQLLVSHLQELVPVAEQGTVPMVNDLIRRMLPGGRVDLATVADELGVHPRTLQRRLDEDGVTFGELVQAVRRSTAERYLRETDMPLGHLATELGYLEQSAFSRASRRWFGMSPLAYRRELQST
jgi:AraC-like DNA-binding protein